MSVFTDLSNLNKFKGGGMQQPYLGPYVGQVIKYEIRSVLTEIPCTVFPHIP